MHHAIVNYNAMVNYPDGLKSHQSFEKHGRWDNLQQVVTMVDQLILYTQKEKCLTGKEEFMSVHAMCSKKAARIHQTMACSAQYVTLFC